MALLNNTPYSIRSMPSEERPRERLHRFGHEALSTAELLAIVLGSGCRGSSALQLAHLILARFTTLSAIAEATIAELCSVRGLGDAKATKLKAAVCLAMRLTSHGNAIKSRIENPSDVYQLLKDKFVGAKREFLVVIMLDVKGCLINHQVVSIGTLSEILIHPREVFSPAIRNSAATIILVHNHPSGDPTPSEEDYSVTRQLLAASEVMAIPICDHIIIGDRDFVSMRQCGFCFDLKGSSLSNRS